MARAGDRLLLNALPLGGLGSLGRVETPVLIVGLCALLFFAGRRAPAVAVAVGLWLVLAVASLAAIYWIGNPPIVSYVQVTVRRVEETPAMVTMTLLPLLLALACGPRQPHGSEARPGPKHRNEGAANLRFPG